MNNFYTSTNNVDMFRGHQFNWQVLQEDPLILHIPTGGLNDMVGFNYYVEEVKLSIYGYAYSSDDVFHFQCDLELAEKIVIAHIKAIDEEIMPLYKK